MLELENKNENLERKIEYMMNVVENHQKNKLMITQKTVEYPNQIHTILNEMIYKIEKMDSIKNKMKMVSLN
jgi:hypothetical protein